METNELTVKTRVLWSSLREKSNTQFKVIRSILLRRDKLSPLQMREELDTVSPGLFHLYDWLNNERSSAIYGTRSNPGETFSFFRKSANST